MQNPSEPSTPRREFLGQIAVSALALAGTACASATVSSQTAAAPAATPGQPRVRPQIPQTWDDSWSARLTAAKHKAVFDMPQLQDAEALDHAALWLDGLRTALGAAPGDAQAAIIIRHAGVVAAFNDAMWSKYEIGKVRKFKDDSTGTWAVRNPFASPAPARPGAPPARSSRPDRPGDTLDWFAQYGHPLLACNVATLGMSSILAKKVNGQINAIYDELKANLIPGVILQPSGIYALHRAQEAGCSFSA
jgi:hypothetical protein